MSKKRREGSNPSFCATRRKHSVLAACFFCHLQDQQQAQGHQQLFIRALPEEEEEDGQQQQVPGIHTAQVKLVQQMLKLHQFGIMSAPTTSQYAAIEAMRNGDVDIEKMRDEYDGRRRYLVEGLRRIGLPCFEPKGAFYVFPDIRGTGLTSDEFCERFLMEEKVAVISGAAFGPGGEGFIRCCYATSMKDIAEALTRMDNFLTNLRKKQAREG